MPALSAFFAGVAVGVLVMVLIVLGTNLLDARRNRRESRCRKERIKTLRAFDGWTKSVWYPDRGFVPLPPDGYVSCKNFATCGWWLKTHSFDTWLCNGLYECNRCWVRPGDAPDTLRRLEEDPELGPDWRSP